ncbi:nuclear RNA export factor 3-like [Canis lupus familiaris]|uniref:nuclear RNA export factor 3-like n=1 Tax=Canis lupus familiaris TaxID=9615 RepID=UPI0018F3F640|nr:nuclear RNA export factor 3-like [Canis lupus familiaris]
MAIWRRCNNSRPHRLSSQANREDIGDGSLPSVHTMGHNNVGNSLQRRARCWSIYRRRYNNWSEQVSSGICPSPHQQQDGDPATNGTHMSTRVRYTPYAIPPCHWRGNFQKQDQVQANMEGEQKPPERKMKGERQDETSGSWFKIIIPFGIKYEETWLLNLIQGQCSVPFTPVEFHYEKMQAQFFVENASIAFALKSVNGKIWDENNETVSVFVYPSDAPHSVQKELMSEKVEQTKLLPLNPSNKKPYQRDGPSSIMQNASSIKPLNSEVKSAGELDKSKSLQPEEMSANRSSLCTAFPDKSTNISSILELFPKLLCLDSQESPSPTSIGIAAHRSYQPARYYLIYDSGDRQGLLSAYHDEACFSLTTPSQPQGPSPKQLL